MNLSNKALSQVRAKDGGETGESIEATIDAGANAITYTAYGMMEEYFHHKMELYRS